MHYTATCNFLMVYLCSFMEFEQAWDQPSPEEESLNLAWLTLKVAREEPSAPGDEMPYGSVLVEATGGPSNSVSREGPREPSFGATSGGKGKMGEVEETKRGAREEGTK